MAHIRTKKLRSGMAHEIIYRIDGRQHSRYFPPSIPKALVLSEKKKIESEIIMHKANLKHIEGSLLSSKITLEQFLHWYEQKRSHEITKYTLKRYLLAIRNLISVLTPDIYLNTITTNHIEQFKFQRLAQGATKPGINKDLHHLKHPFKLAKQYGFTTNNLQFKKFKIHQPLPDTLTSIEVEKLSQFIPPGPCQLAFEILKYTGIRRTELTERCYKKDFDFLNKRLKIHGKNYEDRYVPLHSKLIEFLNHNPIFQAKNNEDKLIDISKDWLSHAIEKAKTKAGINKKGSAHLLRHSLGTFLINKGFNLREVQDILGHKTLYMTTLYTQIIKSQLTKKFDKIDY